jgi:hypothetical protein
VAATDDSRLMVLCGGLFVQVVVAYIPNIKKICKDNAVSTARTQAACHRWFQACLSAVLDDMNSLVLGTNSMHRKLVHRAPAPVANTL